MDLGEKLNSIINFIKNNKKSFGIFGIFGILLFIYVLFFLNLGNYELLDLDETRYVDMSKVMHQTKDFLTLYLNGEYFFEKPPLYFWLENISFFVFQKINEFTARIPGVLETIFVIFALYFGILKATKNKVFAFTTSIILATEVEYLILSKIAILDILLANCVFASIFCFVATLFSKEKNKKYFWWGFYLFCALATLAKGIPGLFLPFACAFFAGLYTKKLKEYFKPKYLLVGLFIFFVVVLPWHIIMFHIHDPLFFNEYIIKHHIARFLGGEIIHRDEPFWFYFVVLLWGMVPYTHSFFALIIEKIGKLKNFKDLKSFKFEKYENLTNENKLVSLSIIFMAVIFLIFTSSTTKLVTYILPIYPFLALVLGSYWTNYITNKDHKKPLEISCLVFSSVLLLGAIVAPIVFQFLKEPLKGDLIFVQNPTAIIATVCSIISLIAIKKEKRLILFLSYPLLIALLSGFCFHKFLKMDYRFGQKDLMEFSKIIKEKDYNIYTYETGLKYSLNYYAQRNVKFNISNEEIKDILKDKNNIIITRNKNLGEIKENYKILQEGRKFILIHK